MKIKRIEAIHTLEKRLGDLRALIPVYKARCPTYEHVLAKQLINLDLQLIEAKTKRFSQNPSTTHPPTLHPIAPPPPATILPPPELLQSKNMAGFLTESPRHVTGNPASPSEL